MILQIDGYSHEGVGVGHHNGQVYFVQGALKDELAQVQGLARKGGITRCRLERLIQTSPVRQTPPCPFFPDCGGCALQHAAYSHQLEIKRDILSRALRVLGGVRDANIPPVAGMERIWGYRNKSVFAVGEAHGRVQIGFFGKGSRIIQGQGCPGLMSRQANRILDRLAQMLERDNAWRLRNRGLSRVMLRESFTTGQMILLLFVSEADAELDDAARLLFANLMNAESVLTGAGLAVTPPQAAARTAQATAHAEQSGDLPDPPRDHIRATVGSLVIHEQIGKFNFRVSPESFFQVNTEGARKLCAIAGDLLRLTGKETVLDLYCGAGLLGLSLSPLAERIIGIESDPAAIRDARENARLNNLRNAEFWTGPAEEWLPRLSETGFGCKSIDTVILDPPRRGCAPQVLSSLIQSAPARILYISCEPATLARDLRILRQGGCAIRAIRPLDMFPQTFHTETLCLLERT
jgi:23S rRNA (uracil1939-C5)-methyltransferase